MALFQDKLSLFGAKTHLVSFNSADITSEHILWLNDISITKYSNQRFLNHDKVSCENYLNSFKGTSNIFLSIRRIYDDKRIGSLTVYRDLNHKTADIGILIGDKNTWGQGFAYDAMSTIIQYLEDAKDIRKITCGTSSKNIAMINVAHKIGMVFDGIRYNQELIEGQSEHVLFFAKYIINYN